MSNLATVAIAYGDPIVGRALAALLQGINYDVKFTEQSSLDDPAEALMLFQGSRVLILAPGVSAERRAGTLALLRRDSSTANIRVMDLNLSFQESPSGADYYLPWPIRTEDLRRHIEDVLAEADQDIDPRSPTIEANEEIS